MISGQVNGQGKSARTCEKCGKSTRGIWKYKKIFYCYTCYEKIAIYKIKEKI